MIYDALPLKLAATSGDYVFLWKCLICLCFEPAHYLPLILHAIICSLSSFYFSFLRGFGMLILFVYLFA